MAFNPADYKMSFDKENYERIAFRVPKGKKAELVKYAEKTGKSVNAVIIEAIEQQCGLNLSKD